MIKRNRMSRISGLWTVAIAAISVLICITGSPAQQGPPALEITSPLDGTVVAPGETITVVSTPAPGTNLALVMIIGGRGVGPSDAKDTPPFEFFLTIPANTPLGTYRLRASGATAQGTPATSPAIAIQVERSDPVLQLRVKPTQVHFRRPGQRMPLRVIGTFADGTTNVTDSSEITYTSSDLNIATVSATGGVTAVGPIPLGTTELTSEILVAYRGQSVVVPVIFQPVFIPVALAIEEASIRVSNQITADNRMNFRGQLDLFGGVIPENVRVTIVSDSAPFNAIDPVIIPAGAFVLDAAGNFVAEVDDPTQQPLGDPLRIEVAVPQSGTGEFKVQVKNANTNVASPPVEVTLSLQVGRRIGTDTVVEVEKDPGEELQFEVQ